MIASATGLKVILPSKTLGTRSAFFVCILVKVSSGILTFLYSGKFFIASLASSSESKNNLLFTPPPDLGREAIKDERAIDMLAIKGAEDEMARTQKVGSFGQTVNDILANSPGMERKEAVEQAYDLIRAKSGKTPLELRTEAYNMYYEDFIDRGKNIDEAQKLAKEAVNRDFFGATATTETTTTTNTPAIKIT